LENKVKNKVLFLQLLPKHWGFLLTLQMNKPLFTKAPLIAKKNRDRVHFLSLSYEKSEYFDFSEHYD